MRRNHFVGPGRRYAVVGVLMIALIGLPLMLSGRRASAQALTPLYTFSNQSDGGYPSAGLALDSSGHLYGTTVFSGTGAGVIFTINTDGSGFTVLHTFSGADGNGAMPYTTLTLDRSGHLYGTTLYSSTKEDGSGYNGGVVYVINTDGSGFTVLYRFSAGSSNGQGGIINTDGALPMGKVILDGKGDLYGTTYTGGPHAGGVIFTLKTNGTGFKVIHNMRPATDGYRSQSGLALDSSGHLYGMAYLGGVNDNGTVFTLNTNGSGFTVLHPFSASAANGTNADGANPLGSLLLDGNGHLYGTTYTGGPNGTPTGRGGTVFALNVDGSNFMVLLNFIDNPTGSLIFDGSGRLYGTSEGAGYGTVFTLKTDGSMVSFAGSFTGNPDGSDPAPGLVLDGTGHFYGTASAGGTYGAGTVFSGSVVGLLPTTTTLQGSLSTLIEGTPITLTANIAGSGAPLTGLLTVTDSAQGTLGRIEYQDNPFSVTFYPVTGTHTLTAIYGGDSTHQSSSQTIQVVVQPNLIQSFTVKPTGVTGSLQATGTVTLQGPAGPGGVSMSSTSSSAIASVPASLTIAQGSSAGSFSIATAAVPASTNVKITVTTLAGTYSTKSAVLHVLPVGVATFKLNHATVTGGGAVTGTVTLTAPAPAAITVTFGSSNTAVVPVPMSITIPAGSTSGTVTVNTYAVTANTSVTLSATANGLAKTAKLTVKP